MQGFKNFLVAFQLLTVNSCLVTTMTDDIEELLLCTKVYSLDYAEG